MADDKVTVEQLKQLEIDEDDSAPGYKAPAQVDLDTIKNLDADDESLVKYKQDLLGKTEEVHDEGGNNVLVKQLLIQVEGREDIVVDLTGDLEELKKKNSVHLKEGCLYKLVILFRVQREIVSGLRFFNTIYRKGIRMDRSNYMVGSYGPKTEVHRFVSPQEEAPAGMLGRGTYTAKSKFTDDDKNDYLSWDWNFSIKKEW